MENPTSTQKGLSLEELLYQWDSPEEISAQHKIISEIPLLRTLLDALPQGIVILNHKRQLLLVNRALSDYLGLEDPSPLFGKRTGDALGCIHALKSEQGCGTTPYCQYCGAFKVLFGGVHQGSGEEECRIIREVENSRQAMDLRVASAPFVYQGNTYYIFSLTDISSEKRNETMKKLFFHDILNALGGIKGALDVALEGASEQNRQLLELAKDETSLAVEEIQAQKSLAAAEARVLQVKYTEVESLTLLGGIKRSYQESESGKGKVLEIAHNSEHIAFQSDMLLLRRVLGNLVKNALEASKPGSTIEMGTQLQKGQVAFWVKNSEVIPEDIKMQLFKRSFSTKGEGRGLGTYSIKLLTEEYLKGKVFFESLPEVGTIFTILLPLIPNLS